MRELVPYVSCLCAPEEFVDVLAANTHPEIYIQDGLGFLKHVRLTGNRHVRIKIEKLPPAAAAALPAATAVSEDLNFLPAGKIPYEFFEQIVEFFRQVSKKMKSEFEAHAWILWTAEKGYFISVPKQTVGKASVSFTYDDESLPPGSVIVCDIHSHNTMGAFYSGTDDNNDKSGIYYSAVIGKLTDTTYEYVIRFNLYEQKKKCLLGDVFELPPPKTVDVPTGWLDQVADRTNVSNFPTVHQGGHHHRRHPAYQEHPSLWDQRGGGDGYGPFGFNELDPAYLQNAAAQAKDRGQGGKKNKSKKGTHQGGLGSSESYVPGPLDEQDGLEYMTAERIIAQGVAEVDDLPGFDDLDDLEGYGEKYGAEALEAYQMIEDFLDNLEECDEPLMEIIKHAYAILSTEGQMDIAQNGLR
jgi:PRTRC genetic system protein A